MFEADISEVWATVNSKSAIHLKGVTEKMLSKIWSIIHKMAENTHKVTTQLNQNGDNTSLDINLGTNDIMLIHRRIKSYFVT